MNEIINNPFFPIFAPILFFMIVTILIGIGVIIKEYYKSKTSLNDYLEMLYPDFDRDEMRNLFETVRVWTNANDRDDIKNIVDKLLIATYRLEVASYRREKAKNDDSFSNPHLEGLGLLHTEDSSFDFTFIYDGEIPDGAERVSQK